MADSDDDFDRRRRDKFTRERNDYRGGSDRRDFDRGGDYGRGGRGGGGDYDRRRAFSPLRGGRDISPPSKRSRVYDSSESGGGGGGGVGSQPVMLTFKQFLASQDDCIDDQDAVKKYADYKMDFKRQQLEEFFKAHKDEEWFRLKYHPDDCYKRKAELQANIEKRLEVYKKVRDMGVLDGVELNVEKNDEIIRIMDTVAILLEGGTDEDLKALDEPEPEIKPHTLEIVKEIENKSEATETSKDAAAAADGGKDATAADSNGASDATAAAASSKGEQDNKADDKNDDDSGMSDNEGGDAADEKVANKKSVAAEEDGDEQSKDAAEMAVDKDDAAEKKDSSAEKDEKKDADGGEEGETKEDGEETSADHKPKEEEEVKRPRHLHRTSSIFLRTLSAAITKQEVEAMCRNYPGFLRVALADPQPDRKFLRRGWITFERHVNTKEICWKLNNIRLRDTELGAILNRDLSRRVRSVNGIVAAKAVMKSDLKLAAKIVQNLDTQRKLWMSEGEAESRNPLLSNITDYLIEEASAEEEELLGQQSGGGGADGEGAAAGGDALEKDPELARVLDRLLWYLRIVHSVDYYSHSDYHNEDEMPNRCGIIHARGSQPTAQVSAKEIEDYVAAFEQKIAPFAEVVPPVSADEAKKLGLKTEQEEVDKFMKANCQELAKDKYLCPLSGKKFKAPEFVHKHIINRHGEKIEEVKNDAIYYNNYVNDPKRPMLPEHPANKPRDNANGGGGAGGVGGAAAAPYHPYGGPYGGGYPMGRPGYGPPHAGYGPMRGYGPSMDHGPYGGGPRGYGNKRGPPPFGGGPRGYQGRRAYTDWDAPEEY